MVCQLIYHAMQNSKRVRHFLGRFYFYFSMFFYLLGTFLIKQLFQLYLITIVKYTLLGITFLKCVSG